MLRIVRWICAEVGFPRKVAVDYFTALLLMIFLWQCSAVHNLALIIFDQQILTMKTIPSFQALITCWEGTFVDLYRPFTVTERCRWLYLSVERTYPTPIKHYRSRPFLHDHHWCFGWGMNKSAIIWCFPFDRWFLFPHKMSVCPLRLVSRPESKVLEKHIPVPPLGNKNNLLFTCPLIRWMCHIFKNSGSNFTGDEWLVGKSLSY